jgi:hypothetical protein
MIPRLLSIALCAATMTSTIAAQASTLKFDTVDIDIGSIFQHETRVVEFPFVVEGEMPVRFYRDKTAEGGDFHTSCGCTAAYLRPDWLAVDGDLSTVENQRWDLALPMPAGARGTIIATFSGKGYSHAKESTIAIRGNMTNSPTILTVRANVLSIFEVRPAIVSFGVIEIGKLRAGLVTAESTVRCDDSFDISDWFLLPYGMTVEELGEPIVDDSGAMTRRLRFTLGKDTPLAAFNRQAEAHTSIDVNLAVVFTAQIVSPVVFNPVGRLSLGFPRAGEAISRTVSVDLQVADATLPMPSAILDGTIAAQMEVEVVAREAGKSYDVIVRTRKDSAPGKYQGKLRIEFPVGSGFAGHEMPVTIRIRKKG